MPYASCLSLTGMMKGKIICNFIFHRLPHLLSRSRKHRQMHSYAAKTLFKCNFLWWGRRVLFSNLVSVQGLSVSLHMLFSSQTGNILTNWIRCYFSLAVITVLFRLCFNQMIFFILCVQLRFQRVTRYVINKLLKLFQEKWAVVQIFTTLKQWLHLKRPDCFNNFISCFKTLKICWCFALQFQTLSICKILNLDMSRF